MFSGSGGIKDDLGISPLEPTGRALEAHEIASVVKPAERAKLSTGDRVEFAPVVAGRVKIKDRLAIVWTGKPHDTPGLADRPRDYDAIFAAGEKGREAVEKNCLTTLIEATNLTYAMQLDEGMDPLPHADQVDACKYCGGGFGGYALAMFQDPAKREAFLSETPDTTAIQPYIRTF